jgi:CBS domain-containing protein
MAAVRTVMTANVLVLSVVTTLAEAFEALQLTGTRDVVVASHGGICGTLTDRDIAAAIAESAGVTLGDVCARTMVSVEQEDDVHRALELMRRFGVRRLPVVRDGVAVGVISERDVRPRGPALASLVC